MSPFRVFSRTLSLLLSHRIILRLVSVIPLRLRGVCCSFTNEWGSLLTLLGEKVANGRRQCKRSHIFSFHHSHDDLMPLLN